MKKSLFTLILLMLLIHEAYPEVPVNVIILRFSLNRDDKADLIDVRVDQGIVSDGTPEETDYKIAILEENGKEIYKAYFDISFNLVSSGTAESDDVAILNSSTVFVRLPYLKDGSRIALYHLGRQIYSLDLSILCNKNNICDNYENTMSCPTDCMKGAGVPYCDMASDGICNKRCLPEWDPDCLSKTANNESSTPTTLPVKNVVGKNERYIQYVFLLVFGGLILFFLYKRREKKKIEKKRKEFISWKEEQEKLKMPGKPPAGKLGVKNPEIK
jgi:hypothetical protein